MMKPPSLPEFHHDRLLTGEEVPEPMFLGAMVCALKVSWAAIETVDAIKSLANHYLLSRQDEAEAKIDAAISSATHQNQ